MSFIKLTRNISKAKINETLIINVLIKNSKKIINNETTLTKIAEECSISHSSVSRLLSKLGWATWGEFTQSCIVEEVFAKKASKGKNEALEIQKLKTNEWLEKNQDIILNIVDLMIKSKIIIFFGEKVAGNIAQYFSFMFSRKNIMTTHFFFEHEAISFLQEDSLMFLLSVTDKSDFSKITNEAKIKNSKLIILDASEDIEIKNDKKDFKDEKNILFLKLPLVSYFSDLDSMFLMKNETVRQIGIEIFDKLSKTS